ncbi:MAG TPA: aromatic amino acid lyase [Candidatus Acidoferrum sp.]|nr:aromatic amino acid lyase [Candidatus Acidoferrum sp.]
MSFSTELILNGGALGLADVELVARQRAAVKLGANAQARLAASRQALDHAIAAGEVIYGVNTGFGSLANRRVEGAQLAQIQKNLLRPHAAGVGEPLPEEVVRAMLLLLAASLARGFSGIRPVVAGQVVSLLNAGVTPVVPAVGSVGASGDLAPLAHAALVLIGEGEAVFEGQRRDGGEVARRGTCAN